MKKRFYIDSNVFIRFLIKDDAVLFEKAKDFFSQVESDQVTGFISILVLNEVIWILEKYYKLKRQIYIPELINLLLLKNLKIIEIKKDLLIKILFNLRQSGLDFTDLYLYQLAPLNIFSFDKDFEKLARE